MVAAPKGLKSVPRAPRAPLRAFGPLKGPHALWDCAKLNLRLFSGCSHILSLHGCKCLQRLPRPRLISKIEGRGNGIKTAIPNMVDVASSLHRPPGEVTKFFGCELGAQTTYNDDTERSIVNGAHETRVLQDKLSVYIEKFVLCPACKLPETSYKIKHEIIYHNCLACGAREPCDMQVRSRRPVV